MSKVALRVYNREIETLVDQGHIDESIAHCQHVLKTYPKHLETYRLLGKAYLEARRHADAADIFQRVLLSCPDDFVSHLGMSIIREEQKDLDTAIWHMERAYEGNPSNVAVQGELRRLYGRRDGLEPPKIRLTRGALAYMYTKGGQYQQALTEIKSVLVEDPTRIDMRLLMARTFYRGGQRVEATEVCIDLLNQANFCLDANRILIEVLPGTNLEQSIGIYKKRVQALEPYAAFVTGSVFDIDGVPDNAIMLDRLDWDPDSAPNAFSAPTNNSAQALPDFLTGTGWGPSTGEFQDGPMDFSAEDDPEENDSSGLAAADIPDWLKAMAPPGASSAKPDAPTTDQNLEAEDLDWLSSLGGPISAAKPTQPAAPSSNDQPDWLAELGGSASMEAPTAAESQPQSFSPSFSDEKPDWMKNLGAETAAADDSADWLQKLHEPDTASTAQSTPADDDMDWLSGLGLAQDPAPAAPVVKAPTSQPAPEPAAVDDDMDWLAGLGLPQDSAPAVNAPAARQNTPEPAAADADMDWLAGLGLPQDSAPVANTPVAQQPTPEPAAEDDDMDWLAGLGLAQNPTPAPVVAAPVAQTPPPAPQPVEPKKKMAQDDPNFVPPPLSELVSGPGTSEAEQDDAMKWLESLAANQGAKAEELLTQPHERKADVPSWAKDPSAAAPTPAPVPPVAAPVAQTPPPVEPKKKMAQDDPNFVPPPLSELVSGPGTSEAEQDDAMKWLESLAANQGAKAEELLTQPHERKADVPSWAKDPSTTAPTPAPVVAAPVAQTPPPAPQPVEPKKKMAQDDPNFVPPPLSELVSGPGTSEAEQDDAMKWLESLAANQGAKAEELLTQPHERKADVPSWAKDPSAAAPTPAPVVAAPVAQTPPPAPQPVEPKKKMAQDDPNFVPPPLSELVSGPGTSEAEQDDAMKWLESLAANQGAKAEELLTQPHERKADIPSWAKDPSAAAPTPAPVVAAPVAQTPQPVEPKKKMAQDDPNFVPPPLSELVSGPGTSEAEQDDAMKWLESLAANQGAKAEELLTQPHERKADIPSWAKDPSAAAPTPAPVPPVAAPVAQTPQPVEPKKKMAQDDPNFVPPPLSELVSGPGTSEAEQDDAMKWLESLAANQGAKAEELLTQPHERVDVPPSWAAEPSNPVAPVTPASSEQDDAMRWLESLAETQAAAPEAESASNDVPDWAAETLPVEVAPTTASQPVSVDDADDTMAWLQSLGGSEPEVEQVQVEKAPANQLDFSIPVDEKMPWEDEESPAEPVETLPWEAEQVTAVAQVEVEPTTDVSEWLKNLDEESNVESTAPLPVPTPASDDEMPDWLNSDQKNTSSDDDLPDWLKDKPADEKKPAVPARFQAWLSDTQDETSKLIFSPPLETPPARPTPAPVPTPVPTPVPEPPVARTPPPAPIRPAVRQTGMLGDKDGPVLQSARHEMAHGDMQTAIAGYTKLIKRAKFLEEVIYDLKEATYTYPVDVVVWQTLGDAHMRANQLQDALDAYTKAEELLR